MRVAAVLAQRRGTVAKELEDDARLALVLEIEVDEIALLGDPQPIGERLNFIPDRVLEFGDAAELLLTGNLLRRWRLGRPGCGWRERRRRRIEDGREAVAPDRRTDRS